MEVESIAEPWNGLAELRPTLREYLFRHCRDENQAEDVVQDTLLRASRYRGSLAEAQRLRPWLLRIALNVLRDHLRRERRLPRIEADPDLFDRIEGREDVPGEVREETQVELDGTLLEKPHVLLQLSDARRGLRDHDRRVLDSHYDAGRTCGETALVCEIPRKLVKVRLFRARRRLHRALSSRLRTEDAYDRDAACVAEPGGSKDGAVCARGGDR